jgi:hypothetical protein
MRLNKGMDEAAPPIFVITRRQDLVLLKEGTSGTGSHLVQLFSMDNRGQVAVYWAAVGHPGQAGEGNKAKQGARN